MCCEEKKEKKKMNPKIERPETDFYSKRKPLLWYLPGCTASQPTKRKNWWNAATDLVACSGVIVR